MPATETLHDLPDLKLSLTALQEVRGTDITQEQMEEVWRTATSDRPVLGSGKTFERKKVLPNGKCLGIAYQKNESGNGFVAVLIFWTRP